MNPGYEDTFHLLTKAETREWLNDIHTEPELEHLCYIKSVSDLNKVFPLWGTGTFQVKITLGDYLCSEMARRYLTFFDAHGDHFKKNPIADDYVRSLCEDEAKEEHRAEDCSVKCVYCFPPLHDKEDRNENPN
jgi:hypothetical protein